MESKINIIIPAIEVSNDLLTCLKKLKDQRYKNFFVTIVFDFYNKQIIKKFDYSLNILVTGKKNMSYKRNLAAKKFNSHYVAFLDSDAYPNKNWLKFAEKYLRENTAQIVGGPSISFPNSKLVQKITYLSKRSYFVTGYQSFRKYKSSSRYCDWIKSCNILMNRKFFLKYKMNEKIYTGEDKEFFARIRENKKNLKVYHCSKLYIFHNERSYFGFLLQRMVFGMDFINLINSSIGIKGFQVLLPLFFFLIYITSLFYAYFNPDFRANLIYLLYATVVILFVICFEIFSYVKNKLLLPSVLFTIILANISFALGGLISLFRLKKKLIKLLYRKSQNK